MARGRNAEPGSTRVAQNGYHYTKCEEGWRLTHHIIAEQEILNRPLQADEMVKFRGSKDDLSPENIYVIKKRQSSLRAQIARLEADIEEKTARLTELRAKTHTKL